MSDNTCGPSTNVGERVRFAFPTNGTAHDRQLARKYLTEGAEYHVSEVEVEGWETTLHLEEVVGVGFNSVLFSPA